MRVGGEGSGGVLQRGPLVWRLFSNLKTQKASDEAKSHFFFAGYLSSKN